MQLITTILRMQQLAKHWTTGNRKIGFVPTMGYLHEGHRSLIQHARRAVGKKGKVVVSIYVNPTQFGANEDLANYPRDLRRDQRLCQEAGVDAVFVPNDDEMYPGRDRGLYSTYVIEERLSQGMEGVSRPGHFRGVTTIVAKLFNLVLPDVVVFGAKDFQQAAVAQRMAADLNFPLRIIVAPTCREQDGLAMSSRNKYLSTDERKQALVLWLAIQRAQEAVRCSRTTLPAARLKNQLKRLIEAQPAARIDYVDFFDPLTLKSVTNLKPGVHVALAVFIGPTRLIDNARLA